MSQAQAQKASEAGMELVRGGPSCFQSRWMSAIDPIEEMGGRQMKSKGSCGSKGCAE